MTKTTQILLFITLVLFGTVSGQETEKLLQKISDELSNTNTYRAKCKHTWVDALDFEYPRSFQEIMITKKVEKDTFCGFYYRFTSK